MDAVDTLKRLLDEVLSLRGRGLAFTRATPLLGAVPELDSMAVLSVISALEERYGLSFDDADFDGHTFATVGTLADFVALKRAA